MNLKIKIAVVAARDASGRCPFLESLAGLRRSPHLRAKTLYRLARLSAMLEPAVAAYDSARLQVFVQRGEKTETGYTIRPNDTAAQKEIADLDTEEIELPLEGRLSLPDEPLGVDLLPLLEILDEPTE